MKTWHKCLIGGLGASAPLIMSFYFAEWEVVINSFSWAIFMGYLTKVIVLLFLGGLVGFFYRTEESAIKLFQLGIAAPSIVLGLINGQAMTNGSEPDNDVIGASIISIDLNRTNRANDIYFEEAVQDTLQVQQYQMPKETKSQEFWRGFTGKKVENNWFLIYDTYDDIGEANRIAERLIEEGKVKKTIVYTTKDKPARYQVVIAEFITYEEGRALKKKYNNLEKELLLYEHLPSKE